LSDFGLPCDLQPQKILLAGDRDLVGCEAGYRDRNAIAIGAGPKDIVRWISTLVFRQLGVVQEVEQVVEADARPREGRKGRKSS
jgi:hypothetical protein